MITAEPDFAVHDPSPAVVLVSQNQDETKTSNKALPVPGKLTYYTCYTHYDTSPQAALEPGIPSALLQARKAVELASASGLLAQPRPEGEEPLPDEERARQTLAQARAFLTQAEAEFAEHGNTKAAIQFARTAAQIAENARALALGAVGGIYVRQLDRELTRVRVEAEQLREEVTRLRGAHQDATTQLASLRDQLQQLHISLDQERRRSKEVETQLLAFRERLTLLEQQLAQTQSQNAELLEVRDKICTELRRQLAALGQLTQQGGEMVLTLAADILFDFNRYRLHPTAREKLAKLAVLLLLLFPEADVRYEGHTDLVGDKDYNQWLSEQRALSVYRYFLEERLGYETDPALREATNHRLATVKQLLRMNFAAARRRPTQRLELLAQLGNTVLGKGEREPVVNDRNANERNRRVVLVFPPAQVGKISPLCELPPAQK